MLLIIRFLFVVWLFLEGWVFCSFSSENLFISGSLGSQWLPEAERHPSSRREEIKKKTFLSRASVVLSPQEFNLPSSTVTKVVPASTHSAPGNLVRSGTSSYFAN